MVQILDGERFYPHYKRSPSRRQEQSIIRQRTKTTWPWLEQMLDTIAMPYMARGYCIWEVRSPTAIREYKVHIVSWWREWEPAGSKRVLDENRYGSYRWNSHQQIDHYSFKVRAKSALIENISLYLQDFHPDNVKRHSSWSVRTLKCMLRMGCSVWSLDY